LELFRSVSGSGELVHCEPALAQIGEHDQLEQRPARRRPVRPSATVLCDGTVGDIRPRRPTAAARRQSVIAATSRELWFS
jgi:hypothetical protein